MTPLVIVGVVLLTALVWAAAHYWARARTTERIHCEKRDVDVDVTFERKVDANWEDGERVDVTRCTAFDDPDHVTCDKDCVPESGRSPAKTATV